ncbi:uncharacterized protein N7483_012391 [Penicillium malachiteum]|uniref:uncharacterized protein n=1 Tax=Penicillium malachiteum TaxID=1324776 RepID=UPI0025472609|nr:uncharacterized protein N7483_012391 [Penicillium malachiteum]KAJ5715210.1 hypothetical protein N7483_012391 [Penicillium malachiteum]
MDANIRFVSNTEDRRRVQNRLAQRKSRERRRRIADNAALETPEDPNGAFRVPSKSTSTVQIGDFPINSLTSFTNSHPRVTGALSPNEIPIVSTEPEPIDNFNLLDIKQLWDQINHDLSFPPSNVPPVQPSLAPANFIHSKSPGPSSRRTSSNNTSSSYSSSHSRSGDSPPVYRRTSEPNILPESPHPQLPQSRNNDRILGLITSARVDKGWMRMLHIAAQKGHERIVQVLLLSGNIDVNQQDSDGRTPLIHAIIENHDSVVRVLLSHGARIGVYDRDGRSALHWAVLYQRREIFQQLLEHRAKYELSLDLDAYDNDGWTPLHMSVDRAFETGVLMLLQGGADINAKVHKYPYTGNAVPLMDQQR